MRLKLRNLFVTPGARLLAREGDTVRLKVEGMVCDVWARRVQRALEGLPGVTSARVDLETGAATVEGWGNAGEEGAIRAVRGTVVLHRLRGILSRVPLLGRRPWWK